MKIREHQMDFKDPFLLLELERIMYEKLEDEKTLQKQEFH